MMGTGADQGMIPLSLQQIFKSVGERDAHGWAFSIKVCHKSYTENGSINTGKTC